MKRRTVLLALAPALVGAAVYASTVAERPAAPLAPIAEADWTPRAGDLILTAADDLVGANIRRASGPEAVFSHVGIVVLRDGGPAVVEATPFGTGKVAYKDLATFTRDPELSELLILRPRSRVGTAAINAEAGRLVAADIPFDMDFDLADLSAIYCAELAAHLLVRGGIDLGPVPQTDLYIPFVGERRLITPDALARSAALEPVFRRRRSG